MVTIETSDGLALDGLLTEPPDPRAAVLYLHGKGCNFYTGPGRFIPERSALADITHLSINMRCHDLGYTRPDVPAVDMPMIPGDDRPPPVAGGMWEVLADGHKDVGAAVRYLREGGYQRMFIAGHSSGGFYTADYCARDPDIAGRIMLSPLTSNKVPVRFWFPTDEALEGAVSRARELVASGDGHRLIPLPTWFYAIAASSLLERIAEEDDAWMKAASASIAPMLMIWGGAEGRSGLWAQFWSDLPIPDKEQFVVEGADHLYVGFEAEVTQVVDDFLERH
jgi:pimeloyl-ACP methyl ester carboxylesterase